MGTLILASVGGSAHGFVFRDWGSGVCCEVPKPRVSESPDFRGVARVYLKPYKQFTARGPQFTGREFTVGGPQGLRGVRLLAGPEMSGARGGGTRGEVALRAAAELLGPRAWGSFPYCGLDCVPQKTC